MAKLTREQKEIIIKRDMKGYRLAVGATGEGSSDSVPDNEQAAPEAVTPDLRALRRKYFGEDASEKESDSNTYRGSDSANAGTNSNEDEMVTVVPENNRDAFSRGARPKSVIISGGRVKGSQG